MIFSVIKFKTILLIFNLTNIFAYYEDNIIVEITNGKIRGKSVKNYISFKSIPYAEPPVGAHRFEPPKPFKNNWKNEIINTNESSPACLQWDHFKLIDNKLVGAEDCLYLDIFTPNLNNNQLYPVIVYIHGGAFMFGSGLSDSLRHDLLMKNSNSIVVFFNYRLGPLGFLSTGDDIIPGNMGLKDQQIAIKWVKENILSFNGNPHKIMLTGFSAGGASVHLHMLTPGIENLISTAISFSGTALCPWVILPIEISLNRTRILASHLNCPINDSKSMKECLKLKSAEDIVKAVQIYLKFLYNPFRVFGPVIESKLVENSFISDNVEELIKNGKSCKIPWIVSTTMNEGGYNSGEFMKQNENDEPENLKEFLQNFMDLAPISLFYDETLNSLAKNEYSKTLIEKYDLMNDNQNYLEKFIKIEKMFSNELFHRGIWKTIQLHSNFTNSPVYSYLYYNPAPFGLANILANRTDINFGSVHGDDVFLIFNFPTRDKFAFRFDEEKISNKLIKMMIDFANTKEAKYDDLIIPKNEPNSNKISYLKIVPSRTSIVIEDIDSFE